MRARDAADRPLAVLVDDHAEAANEHVAVMKVVRLPKVALVIEQFVDVLHPFKSPASVGNPRLPELHDRAWRQSAVRQVAAKIECPSAGCRAFDLELLASNVQGDTVPLQQVRDANEIVVEVRVREAQRRSGRLTFAHLLGGSDGPRFGNLATDDPPVGGCPPAHVELERGNGNSDDPLRDANGRQLAALDKTRHGVVADAEPFRGFLDRVPALLHDPSVR